MEGGGWRGFLALSTLRPPSSALHCAANIPLHQQNRPLAGIPKADRRMHKRDEVINCITEPLVGAQLMKQFHGGRCHQEMFESQVALQRITHGRKLLRREFTEDQRERVWARGVHACGRKRWSAAVNSAAAST